MGRLVRVLLLVIAVLALVMANLPGIWGVVANDNDPRGRIGNWSFILHTHATDELVIRRPDNVEMTIDYGLVSFGLWVVAATAFLVLGLLWRRGKRGSNVHSSQD